MTPINITHSQLLFWDSEIEKMNGSILGQFNRSKITEFYRHNGARIKTIKDKINALQNQFFVIENNSIKQDGEGAERKPVMLEGKTMEDYGKEYTKLMQEIISINL